MIYTIGILKNIFKKIYTISITVSLILEFLNGGIDQIRHENGYIYLDRDLTEEHLYLTGTETVNKTYESISTVSERTIPNPRVIDYISEEGIVLIPGFDVQDGATFLADIDTFPVTGLIYRYFIKDHLGSVRVEFEDVSGVATLRSQHHFYPFGCEHKGSWNQDTRNNHLYTGQERQGSFNLEYLRYKVRFGDPLVMGRFQSPDPLSEKFSHVNPFNCSENSPIANIDLWGLQAVSIHSASFAPFQTFGGPFKGDGANRGFTTNPNASSRIYGRVDLNLSGTGTTMTGDPVGRGSVSHNTLTGNSTFSEAEITTTLDESLASDGTSSASTLGFRLSGNNDLIPGSPDIDTKGAIGLGVMDFEDGSSAAVISGSIFGDNFPANETFLTDQSGTGVFLGVSGAQGNPFTSLLFNNSRSMSEFNMTINFNKDGNISGVNYNGTNYSVEEWNSRFLNLNPQDGNTSSRY